MKNHDTLRGKMKLTKEQLESILIGAVSVSEENGVFSLSRFTEKQEAYYKEKSPLDLHRKVFASAGMRLDFLTDADALSFDIYVISASSRTFYSFDLYIDGIFCDELYVMNFTRKKEGTVSFPLPEGTHRVTLYFPNLMRTDIADLTAAGASFVKPTERKTKLLFLGDSITQGYDAYHSSLSYTNRVAHALDADILNQAIGGEVFDADILDENLPFDPETVIVAYGTNDWALKPSFEALIEAAERFFTRTREIYPQKKMLFISPIWRGKTDGADFPTGSFEQTAKALSDLAAQKGFLTVDGFRLTPHHPDFFADQYLHPNDLGFAFYAENLLNILKKI